MKFTRKQNFLKTLFTGNFGEISRSFSVVFLVEELYSNTMPANLRENKHESSTCDKKTNKADWERIKKRIHKENSPDSGFSRNTNIEYASKLVPLI